MASGRGDPSLLARAGANPAFDAFARAQARSAAISLA